MQDITVEYIRHESDSSEDPPDYEYYGPPEQSVLYCCSCLHHILNIIGCWIKNCYIRAKTALGTTRLKAKSLLSTITLKKTRTQSYDPKNTSDVRLQYLVPPPKAAHTTTTTIDDSPCSL
ncbi:hypothetical protein DTO013E5_1354 [Penicillium roqueforti]|nr:hypothetical protein CBS147337_1766 [Penicillium roqueforti]KAI2747471.1 hypothetical protein DTO012A1_117 [Penicillium roqueforti]KAI2750952.1 hypothetical protein DTO013F2_4203 [Penicillium roqueforti]KAI2762203.1 hypothetical protein DTO006G1_2961 [Penicillium roqueforti]KAI2775014.1 hypothetical protein DTO012A8_499 [Penicillium roqueforti]